MVQESERPASNAFWSFLKALVRLVGKLIGWLWKRCLGTIPRALVTVLAVGIIVGSDFILDHAIWGFVSRYGTVALWILGVLFIWLLVMSGLQAGANSAAAKPAAKTSPPKLRAKPAKRRIVVTEEEEDEE